MYVSLSLSLYIYIYIYIHNTSDCVLASVLLITDGVGAPDPSPRDLVNWCF